MVYFDARDVNFLALNLSDKQLRAEISEHLITMLSNKDGRPIPIYKKPSWALESWASDYRDAVCLAISIQQWLDSESTPTSSKSKARRIDVESIKNQADLVSIASRYTKLRRSGSRMAGCCPFHKDKNPSFIVYPDNQWRCFGACNTGGDVISFIQKAENTDFRGAVAILEGSRR